MGLIRKGGTTILQNYHAIVKVGGVTDRCLDDEFSGHAH